MHFIFLLLVLFNCHFLRANEDDEIVDVKSSRMMSYKNIYILKNADRNYFGFSAKYPLFENHLDEPMNYNIFLAYSQKSIWRPSDASGNDENFLYSNFNPEIIYQYNFRKKYSLPLSLQFGFEHESDGLGKVFDGLHREWNRLNLTPRYTFLNEKLAISLKIWYASLDNKYNPDIVHYVGHGELKLSTILLANYYQPKVEITLRKGTSSTLNDFTFIVEHHFDLFNLIQTNHPTKLDFYTKYFYGYYEYLSVYKNKSNVIRFGLSYDL